ncbi:O-glucosyltransferase rumi homolog [Prorops nasuta]|uniref:O-glucosyltransferase rumi homolog n=1 Tax=Prorops nasuta TaxID=863751 RepID=UPI0034CD6F69
MYILYCLLLSLLVFECYSSKDYCSIEEPELCTEKREDALYTKVPNGSYDKYIKAVQDAKMHFTECNNTKCECFKEMIDRDLRPFKKKGLSQDLINSARNRGTFYQIIRGMLYREKDCMFPSRCAGIEHFLLKVAEKMPDMDLIVNTRDYPQSSKHFGSPLPIFSFSKTDQYYDIAYPAWSFWEGGPAISLYPKGLGRWDQHRASLDKANKRIPWNRKEIKAFFRGSRTSSERDNLVKLSRHKPDLVDARYTKNQAWKSNADTLHAPPAPEISLEDHCKYKYLFNYRGVAASFRHKHLFLCRSLVFHVGNEWTEFYYDTMKPWLHYIPVSSNAKEEDLEELILFAKSNNDISEEIANRGRDFIWNNLKMSHVTCYWKRLLKAYSKLLSYEPTLMNDPIIIYEK